MIVTCAIIEHEGRYLICRRAPGQNLAGYWEFPGGKIEPGETVEECLERELFEELGIRTRASQVIAVTDIPGKEKKYRLMALQTEILGGKLGLTVHDAVEWASKDEMASYKLAPADLNILKHEYFQKSDS